MSRRGKIVATLTLLACFFAALPAIPDDSRTKPGDDFRSRESFILGNLEFALLHEIAHILIAEFDIPVLGPEEQAADYIAITMLIRADGFDIERADRARAFLVSTAEAFEMAWEIGKARKVELPFWDAHGLGIQRFYQIVCLIYGADPLLFARLPARTRLPESRKATCPLEFAKSSRAVDWLEDEYGRRADDPVDRQVRIEYRRATSRSRQEVLDLVRSSGIVEDAVTRLEERFRLRAPIKLVFRGCGSPDAWYEPKVRELTVCHELLELYSAMAAQRRGKLSR